MKSYYDGFQITDLLSKAMSQFEKDHPSRHCETEALERFLENEGYYMKAKDPEAK